MVYGYGHIATDTTATEEGDGRRARWSSPGAKEWAAKDDGSVTWPTNTAPADNAGGQRGALAEDNSKEEAADGTAGAIRLFGSLAASADGGGQGGGSRGKAASGSNSLDHTTNNTVTRQGKEEEQREGAS